jgi:hypothetical protein
LAEKTQHRTQHEDSKQARGQQMDRSDAAVPQHLVEYSLDSDRQQQLYRSRRQDDHEAQENARQIGPDHSGDSPQLPALFDFFDGRRHTVRLRSPEAARQDRAYGETTRGTYAIRRQAGLAQTSSE